MRNELQYLSLSDWLQKHRYDERTQFNKVKHKLEALKKGEKVFLTDMNRAAREQFTNEIIPVCRMYQLDQRCIYSFILNIMAQ